jgi:hypothetical protein
VFASHCNGKLHRKKLATKANAVRLAADQKSSRSAAYGAQPYLVLPSGHVRCTLCSITCTSFQSYQQHASGTQHRTALRRAPAPAAPLSTPVRTPAPTQPLSAELKLYYCYPCNSHFRGKPSFDSHLCSRVRVAPARRQPSPARFECKSCARSFHTARALALHSESASHAVRTANLRLTCKPRKAGERHFDNHPSSGMSLALAPSAHQPLPPAAAVLSFECEICGRSFPTSAARSQHMPVHARPAEPRYYCYRCDSKFVDEQRFAAHWCFQPIAYPPSPSPARAQLRPRLTDSRTALWPPAASRAVERDDDLEQRFEAASELLVSGQVTLMRRAPSENNSRAEEFQARRLGLATMYSSHRPASSPELYRYYDVPNAVPAADQSPLASVFKSFLWAVLLLLLFTVFRR